MKINELDSKYLDEADGVLGDTTSQDGDPGDGAGGDGLDDGGSQQFDDGQVLSYLQSKGIKFNSIDELNKAISSSTETKKQFSELNRKWEALNKHSDFKRVLNEALNPDAAKRAADDLPDFLQTIPEQDRKFTEKLVKHYATPIVEEIRKDIIENIVPAIVGAELFKFEHKDFNDFEEEIVNLMGKHGVAKVNPEVLETYYEMAKANRAKVVASEQDRVKTNDGKIQAKPRLPFKPSPKDKGRITGGDDNAEARALYKKMVGGEEEEE